MANEFLTPTIVESLNKIAEQPLERKNLWFRFGQEHLLPLEGPWLEKAINTMFEYFLQHKEKWRGELLVPEFYRKSPGKAVFRDIWFPIREFFAWCVLYPEEAELYYRVSEDGLITMKEAPPVRLLEKDDKKDSFKTEAGQRIAIKIKKERSTKLASSHFTLGQKDSIINAYLIGPMQEVKPFNIAPKVPKAAKTNTLKSEKGKMKEKEKPAKAGK